MDKDMARPDGTGFTSLRSPEPETVFALPGDDPSRGEVVGPDEVVWLRDLDGTGSMHPCTPHDPGAIRYIREDI